MTGPPLPSLPCRNCGATWPKRRIYKLSRSSLPWKRPDRGSADALIAPLRRRLATLRPPRRLRFGRLLFHVMDPLIVAAPRWRLSDPTLPRTALAPMAVVAHAAMSPSSVSLIAALAAHSTADADFIKRTGSIIWPEAARALLGSEPPDEWAHTGLTPATYRTIATRTAALLSQAAAFEALCDVCTAGSVPPDANAVGAIVRGVAEVSDQALPMVFSLFMRRLPEAVQFLVKPYPGSRAVTLKAAFDHAAETVIAQIVTNGPEKWVEVGSLVEASGAARRIAALLANLGRANLKASSKATCVALTSRLDAACRSRFEVSLRADLHEPLQYLQTGSRPVSSAMLEDNIRGLRIFELQARTIGNARTYDALLATAAEKVKSAAVAEKLGPVEQARLVELLTSADAALAMLKSAQSGVSS